MCVTDTNWNWHMSIILYFVCCNRFKKILIKNFLFVIIIFNFKISYLKILRRYLLDIKLYWLSILKIIVKGVLSKIYLFIAMNIGLGYMQDVVWLFKELGKQ